MAQLTGNNQCSNFGLCFVNQKSNKLQCPFVITSLINKSNCTVYKLNLTGVVEVARYVADYRSSGVKRQNLLEGTGTPTVYTAEVSFSLIPPLNLELKKVNQFGNTVNGATFTVTATQDGNTLLKEVDYPVTDNGTVSVPIIPKTKGQITVTIKEKTVPENHLGISKTITIIYTYDSNNNTWVKNSSAITGWTYNNTDGKYHSTSNDMFKLDNSGKTITVYNYYIPPIEITLQKSSNVIGGTELNATFSVIATQSGVNDNLSGSVTSYTTPRRTNYYTTKEYE